MNWNKLLCNRNELQLRGTLNGGQSFRWTHNKDKDEWTGIFNKTVWKLKQSEDFLQYQIIGSLKNPLESIKSKTRKDANEPNFEVMLKKYFRLELPLTKYYEEWSEKDALFKTACKQFYGIRMLAQEPVENLFSFICSQNNHISRISSMVEKLCTFYGEEICEYEGVKYYSFPDVNKLSGSQVRVTQLRALLELLLLDLSVQSEKVEQKLRDLGFGYRAKFIQKSAAQIVEWGGEEWFDTLQNMKYKDARQELMKLCGIGPKVADCICLMSLNHLEALPVDTHVYQIAAHNYLPHLRGKKNVTDKMYAEIGDHFRQLYGDMAGWAHTVLFCADLKKFQTDTSDIENSKPKKKRKK